MNSKCRSTFRMATLKSDTKANKKGLPAIPKLYLETQMVSHSATAKNERWIPLMRRGFLKSCPCCVQVPFGKSKIQSVLRLNVERGHQSEIQCVKVAVATTKLEFKPCRCQICSCNQPATNLTGQTILYQVYFISTYFKSQYLVTVCSFCSTSMKIAIKI